MPEIVGPVAMMLLEKNGVSYLMIADQHDAYTIGGCQSPNAIMVHDYLDAAFFKGEQWDFYFEQGTYGIEETNPNGILNDGVYGYDAVAFPFWKDLGRALARELLRPETRLEPSADPERP